MSKTIEVTLPKYVTPRNAWRELIHSAASDSMTSAGISYSDREQLSVEVCLYMDEGMLSFHDVDNRLKDVLDALQGRAGGPKSVHRFRELIPNDRQVYRATVAKRAPPPGAQSGGTLTISVIDG